VNPEGAAEKHISKGGRSFEKSTYFYKFISPVTTFGSKYLAGLSEIALRRGAVAGVDAAKRYLTEG